tara:strand:+ start:235 stop:480 length:246 start_codon:yes stop_codon:yes gene_type:complete
MKLFGTKLFNNSKGETVECVEIVTCYPTNTAWDANAKQRQRHADKNNNGKVGQAGRFWQDNRGREAWVDTDAQCWWLVDPR